MLRTYSCTAADTVKTDSIAAALNFLPKNWKTEEYKVLFTYSAVALVWFLQVVFFCFVKKNPAGIVTDAVKTTVAAQSQQRKTSHWLLNIAVVMLHVGKSTILLKI